MSLLEVFGLCLLGLLAWFWLDSIKASEAGVAGGRRACEAEGLQFLDDTVSLESVKPVRDEDGQLRLCRVYGFEYSDTGNNRCKGSVTLVGHEVVAFYIRPRLV